MSRRLLGIVCFATLATGLVAGWVIGRVGTAPLQAQQGAGRPLPPAAPRVGTEEALYAELDAQYERFRVVDQTFALVARSVSPSLVHIVARKDGVRDDGSRARFEETGSGVIVRTDADAGRGRYVLTNNHVVEGAKDGNVTITLQDGRVLAPDHVWTDPKLDIAVLRLNRSDLPAARLGNSDQVLVGSWVLAMGSPFGLTHSVSQGIISARSRYEPQLEEDGVENQDFLQTDAAINPGNSGGPLVNMRGEVIGINTAIASNGGGNEGVGFSIPINLAKWALNQLVTHGRVSRGAIGVKLQDLTAQVAQDLGLERPRGARVEWVQPDTPAARAGLQRGDVILRFNDIDIIDYNHLITMVSTTPIGQAAPVLVWRDGKAIEAEIAVAERDGIISRQSGGNAARTGPEGLVHRPRPGAGTRPADLSGGLQLAVVDDEAKAKQYGWPATTRGVVVVRIDANAAMASILEQNDLIEAIDGKPVRVVADVRGALGTRGEHAIQFERQEKGTTQSRLVHIEVP